MSSKHLLRVIVIWIFITINVGRDGPPNCFPCSCERYRTMDIANCTKEILKNNAFTDLGNVTSILKNITSPVEVIVLQDLPINILMKKKFHMVNENLRKLKELKIINCQIEIINPGVFDQTYLYNLEKLKLSKNKLTDLEENSFFGLPHLKSLYLDENKLKILNGSYIFANLRDLVQIDLSSNELYYLDENLFVNNQNLKQIDLSNNRFQSINAAFVKINFNLEKMIVHGNPWNCTAIEAVMFQIFQQNLYDIKSLCGAPEEFKNHSWIEYSQTKLSSNSDETRNNCPNCETLVQSDINFMKWLLIFCFIIILLLLLLNPTFEDLCNRAWRRFKEGYRKLNPVIPKRQPSEGNETEGQSSETINID